jgi:hypothetical protein
MLTKQLLYQLSYAGFFGISSNSCPTAAQLSNFANKINAAIGLQNRFIR